MLEYNCNKEIGKEVVIMKSNIKVNHLSLLVRGLAAGAYQLVKLRYTVEGFSNVREQLVYLDTLTIDKENWKDNCDLLINLLSNLENDHESIDYVTGFISVGTGDQGFIATINYLYDQQQLDEHQAMRWEEEYRDAKELHQRTEMELMN